MRKLEVEELEYRLVPSSAGPAWDAAPAGACAPGPAPALAVVRFAPPAAGATYAAPAGPVEAAEGSAATVSFAMVFLQESVNPDPGAATAPSPPTVAVGAGGDLPQTGAGAAKGSDSTGQAAPQAATAPSAPAGSSPRPVVVLTQAVVAPAAGRPSPPPRAPLGVQLAVFLAPVAVSGPVAHGPLVGGGGSEQAVESPSGQWTGAWLLPPRTGTVSEGAAWSGGQAGQGPGLPAVPPGDVLAALPPTNLSGLEVALKQFLDGLGHCDACPAGDDAAAGWYPLVVAGVAAAAAGEVARRRLRYTAIVPALVMDAPYRTPGTS
jgi:hypothetical protein